jgi:hypothetical protein
MTVAAAIAASALAVLAGLHAIWIFSPWPLRSRAAFAEYVVGTPGPITAAVAVLLATAAYLVAARAGLLPEVAPHWLYVVGTYAVAGVLALRGGAGLIRGGVRPAAATAFNRLDVRYYSPLCLVLAGLALWTAVS